MKKYFEILRTGKFKDSNGKEHNFTEDDLDKIVSSYSEEAPIVVGHPKTNSPAFGWVEKLKRVGDKLFALPKQLNADFKEAVNNGSFKKVSVSLYPDLKLRHVGFLGAAAPAVKGLSPVEFAEEAEIIEFAETVEEVQPFEEEEKDFNQSVEDLLAKIENLESTIETLKTQNPAGEFTEKIEKIEVENARLKKQLQNAEFNQYLSRKEDEGYLLPAQKKIALELLEFAAETESYDFSESGSSKPVDVLKAFIESLPKQIEFSESGDGGKTELSDRDKALEEIRSKMKNKN